MDALLSSSVEAVILDATGQPAKIVGSSQAGGGCINDARVIQTEDGRQFFLKANPHTLPGMFPREAEGLAALNEAGTLRVPKPLGTGGEDDNGVTPFIVLEYIASGPRKAGFMEDFGRRFAKLHRKTLVSRYGFEKDNYLGSTTQKNSWNDNWTDFWRENRLGFQLELARQNGYSDRKLDDLGGKMINRLDDLIGEPNEPPCLLHGDLWGGNYMADQKGDPVLIDPAAYYGRREADLAMTMIFGGFDRNFYSAYEEVWPLSDGSPDRLEIYKLYHYLNHLNLFGGSYYSSCINILQRYA